MPPQPETLIQTDGDVVIYRDFLDARDCELKFGILNDIVQWKQEYIRYFGREIPIPRLTAWYGDPGKSYSYSGITLNPLPWNPTLFALKNRVESLIEIQFNSVLINLYCHGKHSVSWHSDNEPELGENPVIASLSLGATRPFQFCHPKRPELGIIKVDLTPGSLLVMQGETQHHWQHRLPKTSQNTKPRINLTFRVICS